MRMRCAEPDCQSDTTAVEYSARVRGSSRWLMTGPRGHLCGQSREGNVDLHRLAMVEELTYAASRFYRVAEIEIGFRAYEIVDRDRNALIGSDLQTAEHRKREKEGKRRNTASDIRRPHMASPPTFKRLVYNA